MIHMGIIQAVMILETIEGIMGIGIQEAMEGPLMEMVGHPMEIGEVVVVEIAHRTHLMVQMTQFFQMDQMLLMEADQEEEEVG